MATEVHSENSDSEEEHTRFAVVGGRRWVQRVKPLLLSSLVLSGATVGIWLAGKKGGDQHATHGSGLPSTFEMKTAMDAATWSPNFQSQCGKMDVDVEYQDETSGWGKNYDHIPTPEMCCAMCQGVPKCKAFTWVKEAGLEGCPSQCWLKGGTGIPRPKKGLVSGLPPPRKAFDSLPSNKGAEPGTSLFCFSLMVPGTDEQKLLAWQHEHQVSIFACEGFAIYSSKAIQVTSGVTSVVIDSDLKCGYGGDSQSALNAWIFIALFRKLLHDGDYARHDWSVKADPDAVFFPDRLRRVVLEHQDVGYINNCKYGMHGPIEVFAKSGMVQLAADYNRSWDGKAPKSCVEGLDFGQWGEDMFLDQCLSKILKVEKSPADERLMCEDHCDCPAWYWCTNGTERVSFHPFKTVDAYAVCMGNALDSATTPSTLISLS